MSKELIERLRGLRCFGPEHFAMLYEAADTIEQLQAREAKLREALAYCASDVRPEMQSRQLVALNALAQTEVK